MADHLAADGVRAVVDGYQAGRTAGGNRLHEWLGEPVSEFPALRPAGAERAGVRRADGNELVALDSLADQLPAGDDGTCPLIEHVRTRNT